MRRTLMAIALCLPVAAFAATDPLDQWTQCEQDNQCVVVEGVCNPAAVRAGFENPAGVYFKERKMTAKCAQQFWQPSMKDARAKCWQQRCQIVGKD